MEIIQLLQAVLDYRLRGNDNKKPSGAVVQRSHKTFWMQCFITFFFLRLPAGVEPRANGDGNAFYVEDEVKLFKKDNGMACLSCLGYKKRAGNLILLYPPPRKAPLPYHIG